MGADVLAWLGGVAVTVWEWARATFVWTDLMPLVAIGVSLWVLKQNKASREVAEEAKDASNRGNVIALGAKAAADEANGIARGSNTLSEKANGHSERATEVAERMEKLAQEANDFARRALTTGEGAKDAADKANDIARAANVLAKEANDLFKQQDERETERHDVRWEGEFVRPGVYRLTNMGEHTAHRVVAKVIYDDEEQRVEAAEVPGKTALEFELAEAENEFRKRQAKILGIHTKHRQREREQQERAASMPFLVVPLVVGTEALEQMEIGDLRRDGVWVKEYVQWETVRGNPKTHDGDVKHDYLGAEL